jgi:hypothetical protein
MGEKGKENGVEKDMGWEPEKNTKDAGQKNRRDAGVTNGRVATKVERTSRSLPLPNLRLKRLYSIS